MWVEQNQDEVLLPLESDVESDHDPTQYFSYSSRKNKIYNKNIETQKHKNSQYKNTQSTSYEGLFLSNDFSKLHKRKWHFDRDIKSRQVYDYNKTVIEYQKIRKVQQFNVQRKPNLEQFYKQNFLHIQPSEHQLQLSKLLLKYQKSSICKYFEKKCDKQFSNFSLLSLNNCLKSFCSPLYSKPLILKQKYNMHYLNFMRQSHPQTLSCIDSSIYLLSSSSKLYLLNFQSQYFRKSEVLETNQNQILCINSFQRLINIGDQSGKSTVYDLNITKIVQQRKIFHQDSINCIKWINSNIFVAGSQYDSIKILDRRCGNKQNGTKIKYRGVRRLQWSQNGQYLAACSPCNNAYVWDIRNTKKPFTILKTPSQQRTIDINWLSNNIIGVSTSNQIKIQDIHRDKVIKKITPQYQVFMMKFCSENNRLVTINRDKKDNINVWSLPQFWKTDTISTKKQKLISLVLSKDQKQFVTLSENRIVSIWNFEVKNKYVNNFHKLQINGLR